MRKSRLIPREVRQILARGFVLLEALLAVAIFSIGVLGLAKCVNNCLVAEHFREEDALARRALENRFAEIEAGSVLTTQNTTEKLSSPFDGMTLKQTQVVANKKNENGDALQGLSLITLELTWSSNGENHFKDLRFYVTQRNP